jgi:hypothetical protein
MLLDRAAAPTRRATTRLDRRRSALHMAALLVIVMHAAAAGAVVTPAWDTAIPRQGHACTDASRSQLPGQRNNTRWSFWAAPSGQPPTGGWPIYLEFQADPFNSDMFHHPPRRRSAETHPQGRP